MNKIQKLKRARLLVSRLEANAIFIDNIQSAELFEIILDLIESLEEDREFLDNELYKLKNP
jgi:hypothetical protein